MLPRISLSLWLGWWCALLLWTALPQTAWAQPQQAFADVLAEKKWAFILARMALDETQEETFADMYVELNRELARLGNEKNDAYAKLRDALAYNTGDLAALALAPIEIDEAIEEARKQFTQRVARTFNAAAAARYVLAEKDFAREIVRIRAEFYNNRQ